jgi:hypothetical protein
MLVVLVGALTLGAAAPTSAATSIRCTGDASVMPILSTIDVRTIGAVTVTSFDFIGTHSFCDRSGSRVEGTWSGHLTQVATPNGATIMRVQGRDVFPSLGGTLDVVGMIAISPKGHWSSWARGYNGTGGLEGVTTHSVKIFPTADPAVLGFRNVIVWP